MRKKIRTEEKKTNDNKYATNYDVLSHSGSHDKSDYGTIIL
jgi:hypothetical protein